MDTPPVRQIRYKCSVCQERKVYGDFPVKDDGRSTTTCTSCIASIVAPNSAIEGRPGRPSRKRKRDVDENVKTKGQAGDAVTRKTKDAANALHTAAGDLSGVTVPAKPIKVQGPKPKDTMIWPAEKGTCAICAVEQDADAFPMRKDVPKSCKRCHSADKGGRPTCRTCITRVMESHIDMYQDIRSIGCLFCRRNWKETFLKNFLDNAQLKRLKLLIDKVKPEFRWCLNTVCTSGQVVDIDGHGFPMVTCQDCNARSCYHDQVPWHDGQTCEEYKQSLPEETKKAERDSIAEMQKNGTRLCPHCGVRVQKTEGCDHMFCSYCHRPFGFGTAKGVGGHSKAEGATREQPERKAKRKSSDGPY